MTEPTGTRSATTSLGVMRRQLARGSALSAARLRITSALILFTFLLLRLLNHALGLVSIDAMESFRGVRIAITRSTIGTTVLVLAATVHFVLGISRLFQVQTWPIC